MSASTSDQASSSAEDIALEVKGRDWRPFPVDHPSLDVCAGTGRRCQQNREQHGDCPHEKRGKHPVGNWGTMTTAEPSDKLLRLWFGNEPRNVGIACGPSGLLVIDEDVDGALEALAAQLGEKVPRTYRVRTSRGWHWYFEDSNNQFGNSPGALADHGMDVRGGKGSGGYVLATGSTHWSGHIYKAADPHAVPASIPEWLKQQLWTPSASKNKDDRRTAPPEGEWNDRPRYGTADVLLAQYLRHLDELRNLEVPAGQRPNGEEFRHRLYLAALDGFRLANCALIEQGAMLAQLEDVVVSVWGNELDDNDQTIVFNEAQGKALTSPWVVIQPDDPGTEPDPESTLLETEVKRERARRKAKAIVDAEDAPELVWQDIFDLLASPTPQALVPDFLYLDSLARIFGPPGGGKTFVTLDLALHIALGWKWCGRRVVEGPVVYVMAEGQAVNNQRVQAWMDRHDVAPEKLAGRFITVPHAVLLTPPALQSFLARVRQLRPAAVFLDTKNAMMVGEENSASDFAVMRRSLDLIRTACGCCCVLIDHTGYEGTRARGSSAGTAAMDTEIRVTKDDEQKPSTITAAVTRDKAAEAGTTVAFTLRWHPPAAVLRVSQGDRPTVRQDWRSWELPAKLLNDAQGRGEHVLPMARYMAAYASSDVDKAKVGLSRSELFKELGLGTTGAARNAWSWLLSERWLIPGEGVRAPTGRHIWTPADGAR